MDKPWKCSLIVRFVRLVNLSPARAADWRFYRRKAELLYFVQKTLASWEDCLAEPRSKGGEVGWVGRGGIEVLLELAGDAGAFGKAEHAERAGQFVGCGDGVLPELLRQGLGRRLVEQGEAFDNLGLIALPQSGDHLLGGGLLGIIHVAPTKLDSKLLRVGGDTFSSRSWP